MTLEYPEIQAAHIEEPAPTAQPSMFRRLSPARLLKTQVTTRKATDPAATPAEPGQLRATTIIVMPTSQETNKRHPGHDDIPLPDIALGSTDRTWTHGSMGIEKLA